MTQAIYKMRGKVLNTFNLDTLGVLKNEEIKNIISAIGCGIGDQIDLTKLRYHKIIIMCDADTDGKRFKMKLRSSSVM